MGLFKKIKTVLGESKGDNTKTNAERKDNSDLLNDYFVIPFLHGEAEYQNQQKSMKRFSFGEPVRLGDVIDFLMDDDVSDKLTGLSVCSTNQFGGNDELRFIDNNDDICDYDLLKAVSYFDEEGKLIPLTGENVTLTLFRSEAQPIVVFVRNTWTCPEVHYIRVYSMVSGTSDGDDMRTIHSKNMARLNSTLLSYRAGKGDISNLLNLYQKTEAGLVQLLNNGKVQENQYQEAVYEGIFNRLPLDYYVNYGNKLLEQKRYFDAQRQFTKALHTTDKPLENLNHGDMYGLWNYNLASCLIESKDFQKAYHYMGIGDFFHIDTHGKLLSLLARLGNPFFMSFLEGNMDNMSKDLTSELEETYRNAITAINTTISKSHPYLTVGFILNNVLRINRYQALSMVICRNTGNKHEYEQIKDKEDIWNYRFADLLEDGNTIVIRYSGAYYQTGIDDDKSRLCHDNSIIMQITEIPGKSLMRIDVAVPAFIDDPDQINPQLGHFDNYKTFVISSNPYVYNFTKSNEDIINECVSLYNDTSYRAVESLLGLMHVYHSLVVDYNELQDEKKQMCLDSSAKIGSCLMELGEGEAAEYYLTNGYYSLILNNMMEYVNCLVNIKDVRAMSFIDNCLLEVNQANGNEDVLGMWNAFLKRRKASVLIDWGMFAEAKEYLKELVKDPMFADFAQHEFTYLYSILQIRK